MRSVLARHPRHLGLALFVVGLLLAASPPVVVAIAAVGASALALWVGRPWLGPIAGALLVAGALLASQRLEAIDRSELRGLVGHAAAVRGYVARRERPTATSRRVRVLVTGAAGASGPAADRWLAVDDLVQVRAPKRVHYPALAIGEQVEARGLLVLPRPSRGQQFDYGAYLRRAGVHAVLEAESIRPTGVRRTGLDGFVDTVRRRAERGVVAGLGNRLAPLARGMVLGQDEDIAPDMAEDFKRSGLAHLLAVSGQNVTLLAILALPILAALGLGRRARLVGVLGLIALYVPLAGSGPSILRAGAMGIAGTVAALAGRPASRWYGLLLAAGFTLALDPRAWQDAGWQLSFAAVVGIFCIVPPLLDRLGRLPQALAAAAAVTVAATVTTAPLMAFHFGRVSVVSLLANLVAVPAVAPIMWLGMLAAAFAQVSTAPAELLNALNGYFLGYLAEAAAWSGRLPAAVWQARVGPGELAVIYAVPAVVALLAARYRAEAGSRVPRALHRRSPLLVSLVIAGTVAWVVWPRAADPPDRFTVSFLDVGQGDATLIQTPEGGSVLVDGGPPGAGIVGKLRKAGVRSLDLAVLTHAQDDHQGGLEAVMREVSVTTLLDGGGGTAAPTYRRVVGLARQKGTRVVAGRAGQVLRVGRLRLRVLSPREPLAGSPGEASNDRSIVLVASYRGFDLFLPADAESGVTLPLRLSAVEALKVAHHGSEDDGLPALLERLRPGVAVIEVGGGNRFGHPRARTLAALEQHVDRTYRTDRNGDVRITLGARGPVVSSEH